MISHDDNSHISGWSSLDPRTTAEHYGIPCRVLTIEDVCLSPSHPEATMMYEYFLIICITDKSKYVVTDFLSFHINFIIKRPLSQNYVSHISCNFFVKDI